MTPTMSFPRVTGLAQTIFSGLPSIAVLGLGRGGTVAAACLASAGHRVHAADTDPARVTTLNEGRSPVDETGLFALIERTRHADRLTATTSVADAVAAAELSIIALDLEEDGAGQPDTTPLLLLADRIGEGLARRRDYHVIVMRTPVPAGTTMGALVPRIEAASGLAAGVDFGVAFVPDFVRPGHAVSDFRDPAKTVIGACDRRASALVERVYSVFDPLPTLTTITIAEMMKTIDGAWQVAGRPFVAAGGSVRHPFGIAAATAEPVRPLVPAAAFGPSAATILVPPEEEVEVEVEDDPAPAEDAPVCQLQQVMEIVAQARSWAPVRVGIVGLPLKAGAPGDSAIFDVIAELKECGIDVAVHDEDVTTVLPFVDDIAMRRHSGPTLRALAFTLDDMMMPTAQDVAEWADVLILARPCALHDIGAVDCRLDEVEESGAGPERFAPRAGLIPIIDACALDDAGSDGSSH
ncbi:GDP-mannose 6-dehydrogenase [Stappia sp. 22II-S9-Z10]|nr:GDP-mannose 6-dehydrogenase [Stappia sp. 22II-S9-Z10]